MKWIDKRVINALNIMWIIYKKVRLSFFLFSLSFSFFLGYFVIAPCTESEIYQWAVLHISSSPLLSSVLSVSSMLIDILISLSVPMFVTYSGLFITYEFSKGDTEKINLLIKYLSIVTSALGKFLLILFSAFFGVSTYAYFMGNIESSLKIFLFILMVFGLPGIFFLFYAKFKIKKNYLLDNYALHGALICAIIAVIGYLYGIIAEPIRAFSAIKNTYAILHKTL